MNTALKQAWFNVVPYHPSHQPASHDSLVRALSGSLVLGQASPSCRHSALVRHCTGNYFRSMHLCIHPYWKSCAMDFQILNCLRIAARAGRQTCGGGNWAFSLCASPTNLQTLGSACSSHVGSAPAYSSMGSQNQSTTIQVRLKLSHKDCFCVPNLT